MTPACELDADLLPPEPTLACDLTTNFLASEVTSARDLDDDSVPGNLDYVLWLSLRTVPKPEVSGHWSPPLSIETF